MKMYKLSRAGQEAGPYTLEQLQAGLQQGSFLETDWAICEGMTTWTSLAQVIKPISQPEPVAQATPTPTTAATPTPAAAPASVPAAAKAEVNPYKAPESKVVGLSSGKVPLATIDELSGTRPWVRLIAGLMSIASALFIVAAVGMVASVSFAASANGGGLGSVILMVVFMGMTAMLIVYPTKKLSNYASTIRVLVESQSFADLNRALAEQRRFWKFYGIIALIYIVLVAGGLLMSYFGQGFGPLK